MGSCTSLIFHAQCSSTWGGPGAKAVRQRLRQRQIWTCWGGIVRLHKACWHRYMHHTFPLRAAVGTCSFGLGLADPIFWHSGDGNPGAFWLFVGCAETQVEPVRAPPVQAGQRRRSGVSRCHPLAPGSFSSCASVSVPAAALWPRPLTATLGRNAGMHLIPAAVQLRRADHGLGRVFWAMTRVCGSAVGPPHRISGLLYGRWSCMLCRRRRRGLSTTPHCSAFKSPVPYMSCRTCGFHSQR